MKSVKGVDFFHVFIASRSALGCAPLLPEIRVPQVRVLNVALQRWSTFKKNAPVESREQFPSSLSEIRTIFELHAIVCNDAILVGQLHFLS